MELTVILCTYNRSKSLINTLESLKQQILPPDFQWEILVIDNNSTDNTPQVVREFNTSSGLRVRYAKEKKQGLSHARNKGILEARGHYVAFIDDDAIADENWVAKIYETFQLYSCDCIGGKIYLKYEGNLPRWLTKDLWGFLACLDYGDEVQRLESEEKYPVGCNMAFSKNVFETVGFFNTDLGRTGTKPIGGEEVEFFTRLLRVGATAIYQPGAPVYHVIQPERLKKSYFRRLHLLEGEVRGRDIGTYDGRNLCGIPLFIFPQFLRSIRNYISTIFSDGWNNSFRKEMNIWYFLGIMCGSIKRNREERM